MQQGETPPTAAAAKSGNAVSTPSLSGSAAPTPVKRHRSSSFDRSRKAAPQPSAPRRIRVGVCSRDKKAYSKPMSQILSRFDASVFEVLIFGDEVILTQPIEKWPIVDCLMSWYSAGFPLAKAEAYVRLRRPFSINDLSAEHILRDRRQFYAVLRANNIPTPNHVVVNRDGPNPSRVVELEDAIEVDGVRIAKPFVEKPVDAEDHNIHIYYPRRLGGGSKRLFRKVGNTSSKFYPEVNSIRATGSYIYEEFLMTQVRGACDLRCRALPLSPLLSLHSSSPFLFPCSPYRRVPTSRSTWWAPIMLTPRRVSRPWWTVSSPATRR